MQRVGSANVIFCLTIEQCSKCSSVVSVQLFVSRIMDVDVERLIGLVQERPAIYNITMKEHHNRDIVEKLWEEISKEVGVGVTECKAKWNSVRSSYTRYLREQKKMPSGSGTSKRKKWYLSEAMSFLKDFVGQHRQSVGNATAEEDSESAMDLDQGSSIADEEDTSDTPSITSDGSQMPMPISRSKGKVPKMASVVGAVAAPMIEFLRSRTTKSEIPKDATTNFLESLVPDINSLTPRRQRAFKQGVLSLLNNLQDEQEADAAKTVDFSSRSTSMPPQYSQILPSRSENIFSPPSSSSQPQSSHCNTYGSEVIDNTWTHI